MSRYAVVFADAADKIRFWNASATRIFGFEEVEALGRTLDLIVPERQRARHWEGYYRVMAGGASRYGAGDVLAVPRCARTGNGSRSSLRSCRCATLWARCSASPPSCANVTQHFEELRALRHELAALKAQTDRG